MECVLCHRSFSTKSSIRRHNLAFHSTAAASFICNTCGVEYRRKDTLVRHLKKHIFVSNVSFECNDCGERYHLKRELLKHIRRKHEPNECIQCHRSFSNKRCLRRHNQVVHSAVTVCFECDICGVKYRRRDVLLRHLKKHEPESNVSFECSYCEAKFFQKCNLLVHIFRKHKSDSDQPLFECDDCRTQFHRKDDFVVHIRQKCKKSKFVCAKCQKLFVNAKQVNEHYNACHGITLQWTNLIFETFDKFLEWKRSIELKDITNFTKERGSRITPKNISSEYACHRSGTYKDKTAGKRRRRFLKSYGSKKLQAHCPAKILVNIDSASGFCKVQYQETHVGHNTKDVNELCHVYLPEDNKMELASRLAAGVPITRNHQDIQNIATQYGSDDEHALPLRDDDLNAYVDQFKESVLFYKAQGNADTKYNALERDDFAIVLMDADQESSIRLYSRKVVCFDNTHDTNPYGFVLHTMMVSNLYCEAKPVAFLFTNRNDKTVIDVFLKCIRERIGPISTEVLMSDMQQMYSNSWIEVMGHFSEFRLWCVHEAWRRNYSKISNEDTRKSVRKKLSALVIELNPAKFESMLTDFLSERDPHAAKFLRYFEKYYADNHPCWAYCYRRNSSLNTNLHFEVFYRKLRKSICDGKKVSTLTQCLHHLRNYLKFQKNEDCLKDIRLQSTSKLRILRQRHHTAEEYLEKNSIQVENIDDNTFLVQSFGGSHDDCSKMHTVTRRESKECVELGLTCMLVCDACEICFHQFYCDCLDSAVRNNMCKHIHAIGIAKCIAEAAPVTTAEIAESLIDAEIIDTQIFDAEIIDANILVDEAQIEDAHNTDFDQAEKLNSICRMEQLVRNSLLLTDSPQQMYEMRDKFLKHIRPTLEAKKNQ